MSFSVNIKHQAGDFCLRIQHEFPDGATAVIGPSGSGKSMLLRSIAGIITPDSGSIYSAQNVWLDTQKRINLPPQKRHAGYLFQQYALFENKTVSGNIMAGMRGDKQTRQKQCQQLLDRFHLTEQAKLRPAQLSGGQRQRTALARMLGAKPEVLLLDEPFSALDTHLRAQLRYEMSDVLQSHQGTSLLITHDFSEAMQLCTHAVVLSGGSIAEQGSCQQLWEHPKTVTCAQLTGMQNFLPVPPQLAPNDANEYCLGIRPRDLETVDGQELLTFNGKVVRCFTGLYGIQVILQCEQGQLLWETDHMPEVGSSLQLTAKIWHILRK